MIFEAPDFLPALPSPLPLQEQIGDFCLGANLARVNGSDSANSRDTFVEPAFNRAWTADEIGARIAQVAAALSSSWQLVPGQRWHKIVAILASNNVDILILSWAVHRIGGGCLMLQPTTSAEEIADHLNHVTPFAMFVSQDLLPLGQEALGRSPPSSALPLYIISVPNHPQQTAAVEPDQGRPNISTLDDLISATKGLPPIQKTPFSAAEASQRVAYYCTTSGTSGSQRIVPITHENMIASVLQSTSFIQATSQRGPEVTLGFLPFNHVYGLLITHGLMFLGDSIIIHHGFDLMDVIASIVKYRINTLYLVPPIINALSRNASILDRFDLSSVSSIVTGGGSLSQEAFMKMQAVRPNWQILSGWGQTESSGIGSLSFPNDIFPGSCGILLPGVRIRLRDDNGHEVERLEEMGEIEIASPSVLRGYIDHASDALLPSNRDGEFWWPTGDVGLFRLAPSGEAHLFIVDRIRDMIKVKGIQVAPGQIETHLCRHDAVAEAAVIGIPDEVAGERALAFIVREPAYAPSVSEGELRKTMRDHNDRVLPEVCRLHDRIIFVDQIPKSASGKVLKREMRRQLAASDLQVPTDK